MADQENRPELSPAAFAIGMLMGGVIGFALWIATDTFALFPAFLGMGVVFGLIFSTAQRRRQGGNDHAGSA